MAELLTNMHWWHWIVGAIALAALETFIPGAVAIWFAISATIVGLLLAVFASMGWQAALPWQLQWVLFAALGVVAMVWYRSYKRAHPEVAADQPMLNQRGLQYIGQTFTLSEPIQQGFGKIRVGDGVWKVSGPDTAEGVSVRVTGVDGAVLKVQPT